MKKLILGLLLFPLVCVAQEEVYDPYESLNRGIFSFNNTADIYFLEPVAKGYDYVVPKPAQHSVTNFFHNLRYPRYLVCDLLEMKLKHAIRDTGRFLINTIIGIGGLFDVAKDMGLPEVEKDIGLALQYNGVPSGGYFVIPFLGPSTVRDAIGTIFDFALDPLIVFGYSSYDAGPRDQIYYSATALKYVNLRSSLIEAIDTGRASSVDYYLFVQSSYYQYRWGQLWDGEPPDSGDGEVKETPGEKYLRDNGRTHIADDYSLPPGAYE